MVALLRLIARLVPSYRLPVALESPRRVLVVDLNFLGDMLLSSPVYRALKHNLPGARVEALVFAFAAPALRANPFVDEIHTVRSTSFLRQLLGTLGRRKAGYDLVLQLNTSLKTNFLLWLTGARLRLGYDYAFRGCLNTLRVPIQTRTAKSKRRTDECVELLERAFGWTIADRSMIFQVAERDLDEVHTLLEQSGVGKGDTVIGIHAHCRQGKRFREWGRDRFASLAGALAQRHGAAIVLTGSQDDAADVQALAASIRPAQRVISLAGRLSLGQMAALLSRLTVFVTVNTGPMHIAIAVGTPTVAIIGGTPAFIVYPTDDPRFTYVADPALRDWDPAALRPRYVPALDSVPVDDVLARVEEHLRSAASVSKEQFG